MSSRLAFLAVAVLFLSTDVVKGQFAATQSSSILNHFVDVKKSIIIPIGRSDFKYRHAVSSPMHLNVMSAPGDSFWTGSVSAQSFNNGKFGRFYCWDAQGNLRSSYLFVDISGKKKRGLKLVFPKHRLLLESRNKIVL
ncbi:MAG TPA: hypothetical protein VK589_15870 [Chryseolinea sp.]|nr:hypothetical protein [Chryseolinea sp.]